MKHRKLKNIITLLEYANQPNQPETIIDEQLTKVKFYYGDDNMNYLVANCRMINNTYEIVTKLYLVKEGYYTFYDRLTQIKSMFYKGITTGYRRKPTPGKKTSYLDVEPYGYAGRPLNKLQRKILREHALLLSQAHTMQITNKGCNCEKFKKRQE